MSDTEVGKLTAKIVVDDSQGDAALNRFEQKFRGLDQRLSSGGGLKLGAAIGGGMAIAGMAVQAVLQAADEIGPRAAMSWEKGMGTAIKSIGIDKWDPGTGQLSAAYQQLNDDLLGLRATMRGVSQEDIYGTASILGSLDVVRSEIPEATRVVLEAAAAFDGLSTESAAKQLGVITNLWKEATQEAGGTTEAMKKVASSVNELGNAKPATEANVLDFLQRFGATAQSYNIGVPEAAALGGLLESKGIYSAEAETALRSALMEGLLSPAVETSKDKRGYKLAADLLGIGDQEMKERLSTDFSKTLVDIVSAVETKYPGEEQAAEKTTLYSKLLGAYGSKLSKLAGSQDELQEYMGIAQEGYDEGTSASKEYERQTDNLSDALSELYGALDVARITAWSSALEPASGIVESLAQGVRDATPAIKAFFDALWSGDTSYFTDNLSQAAAELQRIDWGQAGRDAAQKLADGFGTLITWLEEKIGSISPEELGMHLLNALQGAWDFAMGALSVGEGADPVQIFWSFIDGFRRVVDWIVKVFTPLGTHVSIALDQMTVNALGSMAGFTAGVVGAFQQVYNTGIVLIGRLVDYVSGKFAELSGLKPSIDLSFLSGQTGAPGQISQSSSGSWGYYDSKGNWKGGFASSSAAKESMKRNMGGSGAIDYDISDRSKASLVQQGITVSDSPASAAQKAAWSRGETEPRLTILSGLTGLLTKETAQDYFGTLGDFLQVTDAEFQKWGKYLQHPWDAEELRTNWGLEKLQAGIDTRRAALQAERDAFNQELQLEAANIGSTVGAVTSSALSSLLKGLDGVTQAATSAAPAADSLASSVSSTTGPLERGQNLLDKTAESMNTWCEAASEFAAIQEQSPQLFNQSYIGASGAQYQAFLESEAARGAIHPEPIKLGLQADTEQAKQEVLELGNMASEQKEMPVQLQGMEAAMGRAASLHAALSQTAYKMVVIQEVYGGGIGGTGNGSGLGGTDWMPTQPTLWPSFAEGGYIPGPTLAVVGDAPGGEWVLNQGQMSRLAGQGGDQIVVSSSVTIQGNVYGVQDLDAYMDARDRELESKLANALNR